MVKITEQRDVHVHHYHDGQIFPLSEIGPFHPYHPEASLPSTIWQAAVQAQSSRETAPAQTPPKDVLLLLEARQKVRQTGNWALADELRKQIVNLGWEVLDTKDGTVSRKLK